MNRVLIVDDKEDNLYLLRALLQGNGYEVVTAAHGAEALEMARQNPPDLIVADILMPVMDGFTLCREWKKDVRLKPIPFVFYTATYTDERDREFALSLGADRFIIKPEEPEAFMAIIRETLQHVESLPVPRTEPADAPARLPIEEEEAVCLKQYNEVLIRKVEAKMEQLEQAKRELRQELDERNRTEAELRRVTSLLKNTFEAIPDLVTAQDRNLRVVFSNWHGRHHVTEEERRSTPHCYACYMGRDTPCESCPTLEVFRTGCAVMLEVTNPHTGRVSEVSAYPVFDDSGDVTLVIEHMHDITERKQAEETRAYLASIVESSEDAIIGKSCEGVIRSWNRGAERLYGYTASEMIGQSIFRLVSQDRSNEVTDFLDRVRRGQGIERHETVRVRKDGRLIDVFVTIFPLKDADGRVAGAATIARDITELKRAQEERQRSFEQLRALAARLQGAREEERTRVAREIHDQLGQALTAIRMDLISLVHEVPADQKQQLKGTSSMLNLVDETIQSVRRIATELRPGILDDLGLVAAVEWAGEEFEARTGTTCRLDLPEDDVAIDPETATALFRIFQETLTNVARHAEASEVDVLLEREDGDLTLEVHDNGKGITEDKLSDRESLGILGMRERALLLGGELAIIGAPEKGTTVTVRIPATHRTSRGQESD